MNEDLAGREYWDRSWDDGALPDPVNPRKANIGSFIERSLHRLFLDLLSDRNAASLVEVGGGRSRWLPYFSSEFGLEVTCLDYSEIGCHQTTEMFRRAKCDGRVVCADLFAPPDDLLGAFDIAVSFGVIEHFADTSAVVASIGDLVKPGGLIFTLIPNMRGFTGLAQRMVNRPVFDRHLPLTDLDVGAAHRDAGLEVLSCRYFIFSGFDVVNLGDGEVMNNRSSLPQRRLAWWLSRLSRVTWLLDPHERLLRPNRLTAPYVVCVATKPGDVNSEREGIR